MKQMLRILLNPAKEQPPKNLWRF